ncbi:hypothetical protein BSR29_05410 [Boudabousia liubingyangii]|uniref:Protein kinase domain-containing protein n=1 Tax=Boudabousia liubingyangii TaxID=1921764 RepID=A0A1Q5PLI8_9ACTO|nr:serine/threonine-protein kinase [Boudabousia liubingyangii]OKL47921.1 hypothetical protein BSR29_05410 [Boudabousia liubingyangii]
MAEVAFVGGYRLVEELGRGGSSVVYLARDEAGNEFALKLLHPSVALDEGARARLRREAHLLNSVRDPGVARVYDLEVDADQPFIVTDLIAGPTLEVAVEQRGQMSARGVLALGRRLAKTLQAVHRAGVVHRDLKPANVVLSPNGPVLLDFGVAQAEDAARMTATGLVSGTAGFVPPEVLRGQDPSAASDWWAWLATLLYARTGRLPYGRGAAGQVLSRVMDGQVDTDGLPAAEAEFFRFHLGAPIADFPDAFELLADYERVGSGLPATTVLPVATPTAVLPAGVEGETEYLPAADDEDDFDAQGELDDDFDYDPDEDLTDEFEGADAYGAYDEQHNLGATARLPQAANFPDASTTNGLSSSGLNPNASATDGYSVNGQLQSPALNGEPSYELTGDPESELLQAEQPLSMPQPPAPVGVGLIVTFGAFCWGALLPIYPPLVVLVFAIHALILGIWGAGARARYRARLVGDRMSFFGAAWRGLFSLPKVFVMALLGLLGSAGAFTGLWWVLRGRLPDLPWPDLVQVWDLSGRFGPFSPQIEFLMVLLAGVSLWVFWMFPGTAVVARGLGELVGRVAVTSGGQWLLRIVIFLLALFAVGSWWWAAQWWPLTAGVF